MACSEDLSKTALNDVSVPVDNFVSHSFLLFVTRIDGEQTDKYIS